MDNCNSTSGQLWLYVHDFCTRIMSSPQTRPEVCRNLDQFLYLEYYQVCSQPLETFWILVVLSCFFNFLLRKFVCIFSCVFQNIFTPYFTFSDISVFVMQEKRIPSSLWYNVTALQYFPTFVPTLVNYFQTNHFWSLCLYFIEKIWIFFVFFWNFLFFLRFSFLKKFINGKMRLLTRSWSRSRQFERFRFRVKRDGRQSGGTVHRLVGPEKNAQVVFMHRSEVLRGGGKGETDARRGCFEAVNQAVIKKQEEKKTLWHRLETAIIIYHVGKKKNQSFTLPNSNPTPGWSSRGTRTRATVNRDWMPYPWSRPDDP